MGNSIESIVDNIVIVVFMLVVVVGGLAFFLASKHYEKMEEK